MKREELVKLLRQNGWTLNRTNAHETWEKAGHGPVVLPHPREIKEVLARRLVKQITEK